MPFCWFCREAAQIIIFLFLYPGGWHASTENTNKVECYNPDTNEWLQKSTMIERRYRPGVAIIGNKIYVCGGEEGWDRSVYSILQLFIRALVVLVKVSSQPK